MTAQIILASQSAVRADLLTQFRVPFTTEPSRVDEDAIKAALLSDDAHPRDLADALAEAKARKISLRRPGSLVLGCDQILALERRIFSKAETEEQGLSQLKELSGKTHHLFSAAVLYEGGEPIWRHVGHVRMTMRLASDAYLADYIQRNWHSVRQSVGCYKIEEEGAALFTKIEGSHSSVLGLPLLELLSYLTLRGTLPT